MPKDFLQGPGQRDTEQHETPGGISCPLSLYGHSGKRCAVGTQHGKWFHCQPRARELDDMSARRERAVPGKATSLCVSNNLRPFTLCKYYRDDLCGRGSSEQFTFKYLT